VRFADPLLELGLTGAAYAAPITGGAGVGFSEHDLVSPASVMKIQIALTIENLVATGVINKATRRVVPKGLRTPGPTGMSLMRDEVTISVRDLVVAMLTISDNVATDELIDLAGLDEINRTTRELGLGRTEIKSDLRTMLEDMAREVGFRDFAALISHNPDVDGAPSADDLARQLEGTAALDPSRGSRTTAFETVSLLQAIWTDRAGRPEACQSVRETMARQLTRNRIGSGFDAPLKIAAKSGALMGAVRNEAGVVTYPDGSAFAVAVFTRKVHGNRTHPTVIDQRIGQIARRLVEDLRTK
jgi:beta-lactamase class A